MSLYSVCGEKLFTASSWSFELDVEYVTFFFFTLRDHDQGQQNLLKKEPSYCRAHKINRGYFKMGRLIEFWRCFDTCNFITHVVQFDEARL